MKLTDTKKIWKDPVALAFMLPTGIMLALLFITSALPFGSYTLLYSDMYHQYYPFFVEFRETVRSGGSLLWTWSVGMGTEYLGMISYYLASPLNLLSVLVPDGWVLAYFSLLMPIKLGLASGFFALMLKKLYHQSDWMLTLLSCSYGLCAWALGYQWNIMWLDGFAMLPLVVLGTVYLLRDKKYILYTVSLFLCVFSNYYVGFFVCVFVLLFFFCYELCRFKGVWRFLCDLARIGFFTVLALGMTAILELPTLAALQDTYSSVNAFPEDFSMNIVSGDALTKAQSAWGVFKTAKEAGTASFAMWWDAIKASVPPMLDGMQQVAGQMGGGKALTHIDGLPNLYCGVLPVMLSFLFLSTGRIKLRDKICCVGLLLFFVCSFLLRQLDYMWHGFHFPNQIPYRFSFLFSFVLLYMAYRAWLEREHCKLWQKLLAGALGLGLLLVNKANRADTGYVLFNCGFLLIYLVAMAWEDLERWGRKLAPMLRQIRLPRGTQNATADATGEEYSQWTEPAAEVAVEETADCQDLPEADAVMPVQMPEQKLPLWQRWLQPQMRRKQCAFVIGLVMLVEIVLQVGNFAQGFTIWDWDYPKGEADAASMFAYVREKEGALDFFRTEVTHAQTLNDGALNGYNGISTFTSSANVRTTEFMEALGYASRNNWNRYCWEESSPVANLFLNLRYMVDRNEDQDDQRHREDDDYFTALHTYHNITLLENNYYLPLGFLANSQLADVDFSQSNPFTLQNKMFKAASGVFENVWQVVTPTDLDVTSKGDLEVTLTHLSGYTSFTSGSGDAKLYYTYNMTKGGFLCLDLTLYANKSFYVRHNGKLLYAESYSLPMTMAVCQVEPGDKVEVVITCAPNVNSAVQVKGYLLDDEVFREGYETLAASTLQITDFSDTRISGVIECDRDGLLYTSIPQCGNKRTEQEIAEDGTVRKATTSPEGNWSVYVDGKKADIVLVGNAMIAVELTEGIHTVEFRYENKALHYGAFISFGCAAVFVGVILLDRLVAKKRKAKTA